MEMKKIIILVIIVTTLLSFTTTSLAADNILNVNINVGGIINDLKTVISDVLKMFSDMKATDWYTETVAKLVKLGVIDGYGDGTFRPGVAIKRDEFIKLTVTSMNYNLEAGSVYWARPYIDKAIKLDLIQSDEFEDYGVNITREEMTSIIVNAALKTTDTISNSNTYDHMKNNIKDYHLIADKYKQQVLYGYDLGLITGYEDGTIKPKKNATRAEASAVVMRYLDKGLRIYPNIDISYVELKEYNPERYWYNSMFLDYMKVYPPMRNGRKYKEFIEVAQVLKDSMDKTEKFGVLGYISQNGNVGASFFDSPNEKEFQEHFNEHVYYAGVDIKDISIYIGTIDWDMDAGHHRRYPYSISIYNIDNYNNHSRVIEALFKELFGEDGSNAIGELNNVIKANKDGYAENNREDKDGLAKYDKAFIFNNRRIVIESRMINRVDVYVTPILK